MTKEKNVILTARDIVVEFDVRDKVLTAIRGVSLELVEGEVLALVGESGSCLLYTSPSPRDRTRSRMPSSA